MKLLDTMMRRFVKVGSLRIIDADGVTHDYAASPKPSVTVRLTDKKLHHTLFFNPELKAGEAYMDGTLRIEDGTIRDLLTLFAENRTNLRSHPLQKNLRRVSEYIKGVYQRNKICKSRDNV